MNASNDKILFLALFTAAVAVAADVREAEESQIALSRKWEAGESVVLSGGVHRFSEERTHKVFLSPSNNTSGEKNVVFFQRGRRDAVFDGGGATFVFTGRTFPFAACGCTNIVFRNFTVTTMNPSCAGFVTESKDDSGFVIRFDDGVCPYTIRDGEIVFDLDGHRISTLSGRLSLHALDRVCIHYLLTPKAAGDKDEFPAPFVGASAMDLGGGRLKFTYSNDPHPKNVRLPYEIGERVVINLEERRFRDVFFFEDCDGVRVENVLVRRFGGMGLVAQRSGNINIDRFVTEPEKGERVTLTADIFQFINCYGDIRLEKCRVGDSLDDAINIHGNYLEVVEISDRKVRLRTGHEGHVGFFPYRPGDRIEFVVPNSREVVCSAVVTGCRPSVGSLVDCEVETDVKLSGVRTGMLVENVTLNPDVTITECRFYRYPQIRLSGRGRMLVRGNVFERAYCAMRFWDLAEYWFESGRLSTVEIVDNVFKNCTALGGSAFMTSGVSGWGQDAPKIHEKLILKRNRYEGVTGKLTDFAGFRQICR